MSAESPRLFISHKHTDKAIAEVIANFVEAQSGGRVRVHLSSSREFEGPKYGRSLNAQLRHALWHTDVLILVYTSTERGWEFCMWECGVATDSQSPDTNIIVFQCGNDIPAPFHDVLRVDVRKRDEIKAFAKQFLKDPDFFPSVETALAPNLREALVEKAGNELADELATVVPVDDVVVGWAVWPYLRIELPKEQVRSLTQLPESERLATAREVVREYGVVSESDSRAAQLFGQAQIVSPMKFDLLLRIWQDSYPDHDASWFDSCCEQILMGAAMGIPVIRWTPLREVGSDREFTPVLTRVRRVPLGQTVYFDLYFLNLSDPRAVRVTSKMIPFDRFFYKNLGEAPPDAIPLKSLIEELEARGLNRVPLFSAERHPLYMVHRSMIDKFIVRRIWPSAGSSSPDLSLADLLADDEMRKTFEETFVVVKKGATLAEAKSAMVARPGCSDVFVTEHGERTEPVIGWLTNVDIVRVE